MKKLLHLFSFALATFCNAQLIPDKQLHIQNPTDYATYTDTYIDNNSVLAVGWSSPNSDLDPGTGSAPSGTAAVTYLSKYNLTSNALEWIITYPTASSFTALKAVTSNSLGEVFVTGLFSSSMDIDPGVGTAFISGSQAAVIIKFSSTGNYIGHKQLVASNSGGYSIAADKNNNIYVGGFCSGTTNFDAGITNYTLTTQNNDCFIASYTSDFSFNWAHVFGSSGSDDINGVRQIQFDGNMNTYLCAKLGSTAAVIGGQNLGANAEFILKYNNSGTLVQCYPFEVTQPYGNKNLNLKMHDNGKFYIYGGFYGTVDFDPTAGVLTKSAYSPGTANDQYVGFYENNGTPIWLHTFSQYIGEAFYCGDSDSNKNIYLWGNYDAATDYNLGTGTANFPFTNPVPQYMFVSYDSLGNYKSGKTFMNRIDPNSITKVKINSITNQLIFTGNSSSSFGTQIDYAPGAPNLFISTTGLGNGIITTYDFCTASVYSSSASICSNQSYTLPSGSVTSTAGTYTNSYSSVWGCDSIYITNLTVNPLPSLTVSPSQSVICAGQSVNLSASGANSYTWSTSELNANITVTPTTTITYTLTGTSMGCTSIYTTEVTVNPIPSTPMISNSTINGCVGGSVSISASGSIGTYNWVGPNSFLSSGNNVVITYSSSSQSGTYSVSATNLGCESSSVIFTLTVNNTPTVVASSSHSLVCPGSPSTLTASGANTYTWSNNENTAITIVTPTINNVYTVYGTDVNNCISSATISVLTLSVAPIQVSTTDAVLCVGASATLTAQDAISSYTWNPSIPLSGVISPTITTTYTITSVASNGCTANELFTQQVSNCTHINENEFLTTITVFPNPSRGNFNISISTTTKVTIIDVLGKVVYTEQLESGLHSVNLNQFANGIYLLKAESNGNSKTIRLIKE